MRKTLHCACQALLLVALSLSATGAMAQVVTVEKDGVKYAIDLSTNEATLSDGSAVTGEFVVPPTVSYSGTEYPITKMGYKAFMDNDLITGITLPTSVKLIENSCFRHMRLINKINLNEGLTEIADSAFYNCAWAAPQRFFLQFPSTLKKIGKHAFQGTPNIHEFVYNEGLEEIGDSAFYQGDWVTEIHLPSTLKKIGERAFWYNYACTELDFGGCAAELDDYAFQKCEALTTIYGDENVKSWGNYVFQDCKALVDYAIPAGLEHMGNGCLSGTSITQYKVAEGSQHFCVEDNILYDKDKTRLIAYNISKTDNSYVAPATLKKIDGYAFSDESDLTSITLNEGLEEVGERAMASTNITTIHFPSTVKTVGNAFHYKASKLAEITVAENSPYLCAVDNLLMNKDQTEVIAYPVLSPATELILPETVLKVRDNAVNRCKNLLTIVIDDACTEIERQAFDNCTNCTSLTFGKNVRTIGFQSFRSFKSITSLVFPEELREIDQYGFSYNIKLKELILNDKLEKINWRAFYNCSELEKVVLPGSLDLDPDDGMADTGNGAIFQGCSNLKEVIFKDGSKRPISPVMFDGCANLTTVVLPQTIEVIGMNAFQACTGLTDINLPESLKRICSGTFYGCTGLTSIYLPQSLETLEFGAFQACSNLVSVTGGSGIKNLGNSMFNHCTSLQSLPDFPALETLPNQTFFDCPMIDEQNYAIPEGTKIIGDATFSGTGFKDLVLPNSVETLMNNSFQQCASLETFTAGEGLKTIGANTFIKCDNLRELKLNEGLQTISFNAFGEACSLEKLVIPASVDSIGSLDAYGNGVKLLRKAEGLTEIHNLATTPQPIYCDFFDNLELYNTVQLYVPAGSEELYKNAPFWKKFANINTDYSSIDHLNGETDATVVGIYTQDGLQTDELQQGVNIVRMSDGTSRKVIK